MLSALPVRVLLAIGRGICSRRSTLITQPDRGTCHPERTAGDLGHTTKALPGSRVLAMLINRIRVN